MRVIPSLHGAKIIWIAIWIDRDPQDVPIYTGHPLFNTTKRITLLFIHCYITIHLISGYKLSRLQPILIVHKGQNSSIEIMV